MSNINTPESALPEEFVMVPDEELLALSQALIERNRAVYEELAK